MVNHVGQNVIKIKGKSIETEKGRISFVNGLSLKEYKRFYKIDLPRKNMIRAFHGHMKESKVVVPLTGSMLLCAVELDNKFHPSPGNKVKKVVLNAKSPTAIIIPPKYANGIMSLQKNSSVIFFSNKTVEESEKDDYRYPEDYWGKKVWDAD